MILSTGPPKLVPLTLGNPMLRSSFFFETRRRGVGDGSRSGLNGEGFSV